MRRLTHRQLKAVRQEFLDKQGGRCAICTILLNNDKAVLDHCHKSGYIRAVLCNNCNGIEGKIKNLARRGQRKFDHRWFVSRIAKYWEKFDDFIPEHGLIHPTHKTEDEKRDRRNKLARQRYADRRNGN